MVDPLTDQEVSPEKKGFQQNQVGDLLFEKFGKGHTSVSVEELDENKRSKRPRVSTEGDTRVVDFALLASPSDPNSSIDAGNDALVSGVSWETFGADPETKAALRGYCKFISREYDFTDVHIMMKHKATESYLVRAAEGFFLFSENLQGAKLVARDFDTMRDRIRKMPLEFEEGGPEYLANSHAKMEDKQVVGGISPLTTTDGSMDIDSPEN